MLIRDVAPEDHRAVAAMLVEAYAAGDTYCEPTDAGPDHALRGWLDHRVVRVAEDARGRGLAGTYHLGPNRFGPGAHVANAGFVVSAAARGQGTGRALAEECLRTARALGFRAMQFNAVVATNRPAVRLWHTLGFEVVGRVPGAFEHPAEGEVDLLVMHRRL
ncbi:GNAT family N-acetyltransferase [Nocardioidaceae bacterium]|nr:GNAT family N-acetyltransferase [Nocardioidaceae bacterium]